MRTELKCCRVHYEEARMLELSKRKMVTSLYQSQQLRTVWFQMHRGTIFANHSAPSVQEKGADGQMLRVHSLEASLLV